MNYVSCKGETPKKAVQGTLMENFKRKKVLENYVKTSQSEYKYETFALSTCTRSVTVDSSGIKVFWHNV